MRLIDADKLPYEDIESIDGNTYMCVNAYDIEHASTIEQSEDCISREKAIRIAEQGQIQGYEWQFKKLCNLPSVTPNLQEWLFSFNTDSATECFTAVQELKKKLEGDSK